MSATRLCCWRCKALGCDMQPIPGARIVEAVPHPWEYDHATAGWHDLGPALACTRCHHYGGSDVCGGRRDDAPPIWRRYPRLQRYPSGWQVVFWWRRCWWIARGDTPRAALRQACAPFGAPTP